LASVSYCVLFFFSSRRRHTRFSRDWSSDVCSSDFLFETLVSSGDAVVVEKPTYDRTLLNLRRRGADLRPVELEGDGIDVAALERSEERRVGKGRSWRWRTYQRKR